jgi:hypothetical protein
LEAQRIDRVAVQPRAVDHDARRNCQRRFLELITPSSPPTKARTNSSWLRRRIDEKATGRAAPGHPAPRRVVHHVEAPYAAPRIERRANDGGGGENRGAVQPSRLGVRNRH